MKKITALCLLAGILFAATAHAKDVTPLVTFLSKAQLDKRRGTITRVEEYLSSITTIVSDFTQVAPDGSLATGKFYLKRPGRMRWQYNPPTPILMVSDGDRLVYYDYELEQVNYLSLDETLISFLAHRKIGFDGKIGITDISVSPGAIRISLAQRDKPTEGELMLELSDKPLTIRNMVIRDATNQITSVSLNDAKFGVKLDDELFKFQDPRGPVHRK